jgi:amidase
MSDVVDLPGREIARLVRERELSAAEVMAAHLDRIEKLDPALNAIPTLRPREDLLAEARRADEALARSESVGPLHGLPHAVKDMAATKGMRTTLGSRIFAEFVPTQDALFVERLRTAGAILIGKTNVPEFGAGSQTFNEVFGPTRNPYDPTKTPGGSSGGAAVALACGMVPFADGSDLGGSLRNPGSFTNVVGFRPTSGRVPETPPLGGSLAVEGPLARSVADVAYLLAVMGGPDERDPHSMALPITDFTASLDRTFSGTRIAFSEDLGLFPVEPEVREVCRSAMPVFENLGCIVARAHPDFRGADETFQVLRAAMFAERLAPLLETSRALIKDTVVWNTEKGLALSPEAVSRAQDDRRALIVRIDAFLEEHAFLCLPVSQVAPFPVEVEWPNEVAGVEMHTYLDWMMTCAVITLTGLPAISVPAGFTAEGLPVGLQIVGRRNADFEVLQLAHAFERATRFGERRPGVCSGIE